MFPKKIEIDEIKNKSDPDLDHPKKKLDFFMVNFGAKDLYIASRGGWKHNF